MATIIDMLHCTDIHTALSIIATLSRYQATASELKEDLEKERNMNSELKDKVTKI